MNRTTLRRARRPHYCARCRSHSIQPGDHYLEHVCSPNDDGLGNQGWWRLAECRDCALDVGRGSLFPAVTS